MRRENLDIDIVVEGDGLVFAEKICERYGARKRSHERFGTARVIFPDGFRIDVATARLEYYDRPASLPNVEWSSLKLDLYRRDFTMNTLAIRLDPGRFGELVDFFGGEKDIKDKAIRVIQNLSFIEDPTRIYRALRFSERFGFSLGQQTRYLMQSAIRMGLPEKLDGRRLFGELKLILEEDRAKEILGKMQELDLLRVIHPDLVLNQRLGAILDKAWQVSSWFRFLYLEIPWEEWVFNFLCLLAQLDNPAVEAVRKRLSIMGKKITDVLRAKGEGEKVLKEMAIGRRDLKPGHIYRLLHPLPIEVLLYLMTKTSREKTRKAISLYITKLRSVTISVTGRDLAEMGYEPGPRYREILDNVLDAKLNGLVTDRNTEKEWIVRQFPLKDGASRSH
jgi:tRNA nucleotidyltransferase (CCA-adding enzyme)